MVNTKLVNTFLELAQIDSPSGEEDAVREYVLQKLDDIGFKYKVDSVGNIIARNHSDSEPVLLGAHLDTVEPGRGIKPKIKDGYIISDGTTILGADNKATLAAILHAIEITPEEKIRSLELVFTVREETSGGINDLDFSQIKSRVGVIADSVSAIGTIIEKAPFIEDFEVKIRGRAAHASVPENGINALKIAGDAISTLKLGHLDDETILNIGLISGGDATNTIPKNLYLKGEIRSFSEEKFEKAKGEIENHFINISSEFGATCEVSHEFYGKGYSHSRNSENIKKILQIYKNLNIKHKFLDSYGASDANIYVNRGVEVVNIGDGVEDAHTTDERISIKSLEKLSQFFANYICDRIEAN